MVARLDRFKEQEFGLEGLVNALRALLRSTIPAPVDGRVTELPDARTLRYYQTHVLLDKPLRYDGRKAVYGYRHLLQMLSLKLLQGQGFSLAQIQRALAGASSADLEKAVAQALGGVGESAFPIETDAVAVAPLPAADAKPLIAVGVGRGVTIVIDPDEATDPEVIVAAVTELIKAIQGGTE